MSGPWFVKRADGLYLDAIGGPRPPGAPFAVRWGWRDDATRYADRGTAIRVAGHYGGRPVHLVPRKPCLHPKLNRIVMREHGMQWCDRCGALGGLGDDAIWLRPGGDRKTHREGQP